MMLTISCFDFSFKQFPFSKFVKISTSVVVEDVFFLALSLELFFFH